MDNSKINHVSLCTGYGGIDLGLRGVIPSLRTVAYCEIEAFVIANLVSKMEAGLLDAAPVWTNIQTFPFGKFRGLVDILSGGYPCFAAGTIVCTHRGFIPIEQVVVGDMALTHLGRWRRVTATMSKTGAPVRRIKAQGVPGVVCTDEHPFYTKDGWKDARDLVCGDRIGQVLPEVVEDDRSPEFWWVIGRYLADGWRQKPPTQSCGRITICCNHKEADFLQEKIVAAGFNFYRNTERTATRFAITKKELYEFCGQFGSGAAGKHLPGWVLGLDPARARALCDGYFSGDGYRCKKGGNYWRITTVSRGLAVSFALLAQRAFGVVASVRKQEVEPKTIIEGRTVNQRPQYILTIPDRNRSGKIDGDYGWKYVRRNEPYGFADVYNIAVEEDESYYADGAIVHNCQPFSAAGKRKGKEDERHLWPWIADGIRLCEPRFCFFENVEGHISLGLSTVVSDLEELGYEVSWGIFSAAEVGAPHQRKRVFILAAKDFLADSDHKGLEGQSWYVHRFEESGRIHQKQDGSFAAGRLCPWPAGPSQRQFLWEPHRTAELHAPEPEMGGDVDGSSCGLGNAELFVSCDNKIDELRLLGNGVVPAVAANAFLTLLKEVSSK